MKALLTALALATLGASAAASEATQFNDPPSTRSRADVMAADAGSPLIRQVGDATVFVDPASSTVTRAEVRAQAAAVRGRGPGISYGEATVFSVM
ncbi:hypothetical protein BURC_01225 [Burkholderiaceae bacterium]|nr:hypothetical protein BURC_01225 [Burkholderiaceae bacterium]